MHGCPASLSLVLVSSCGSDGDGGPEGGGAHWRPGADGPSPGAAAGAVGEDQHWPAADAAATAAAAAAGGPDSDQTAAGRRGR